MRTSAWKITREARRGLRASLMGHATGALCYRSPPTTTAIVVAVATSLLGVAALAVRRRSETLRTRVLFGAAVVLVGQVFHFAVPEDLPERHAALTQILAIQIAVILLGAAILHTPPWASKPPA
jgi:hypothetical protein